MDHHPVQLAFDAAALNLAGARALRSSRVMALPAPRRHLGPVRACDLAFVAMAQGYRSSGGLARIGEVARRWQAGAQAADGGLPGLQGAGAVFSFHWYDGDWLPLFQFRPDGVTVAAGLPEVLGELSPVYDGWALGLWFAQPNHGLRMQCPADLLAADPGEVLQAARCDRYVAKS